MGRCEIGEDGKREKKKEIERKKNTEQIRDEQLRPFGLMPPSLELFTIFLRALANSVSPTDFYMNVRNKSAAWRLKKITDEEGIRDGLNISDFEPEQLSPSPCLMTF
ncbi:hypothetical protein PUN28_005068 [Cardiocondyla obscurior]|uniref:Uncharacterized protein n=1 Tax=Cardiocondyla obscurior TaxID=286306 RepID=A0AAW2GI00_9HYME